MRLVNLLINILLRVDKINFMCYSGYSVTALQRYSVTALQRYSVTALQRYHLLIFNTLPAPRFHGGSKRAATLYCLRHSFAERKTELKSFGLRFATKRKPLASALYQIRTRFELVFPLSSFPRRRESTHVYCLKSLFLQRGLFALCRTAVHGFSRTVPSMGRSLHRQIILSDIKYHYLHPLLSFLRKQESRSSLLRQPSSFFCPLLSFHRQLSSFLSLLSFPRRRESSMHFVSLTAIKLWVQGVCQKRHPLGARRRESRKSLLCDEVHYVKIQSGNFFMRRYAWTQKKFPFVFLLIIRTAKRCIRSNPLYKVAILVLSMVSLSAMKHIYHYMCSFLFFYQKLFLRQSLFLRQPSFPRRRESRKSLFSEKSKLYGVKGNFFVRPLISLYRGWQVKKPSSKAQTCGLPQSVSCQLTTLCQIRTRFEHGFFTCLNNKALIKKSPLPPYLKLSFLHQLLCTTLFKSNILKKGFLYA